MACEGATDRSKSVAARAPHSEAGVEEEGNTSFSGFGTDLGVSLFLYVGAVHCAAQFIKVCVRVLGIERQSNKSERKLE